MKDRRFAREKSSPLNANHLRVEKDHDSIMAGHLLIIQKKGKKALRFKIPFRVSRQLYLYDHK